MKFGNLVLPQNWVGGWIVDNLDFGMADGGGATAGSLTIYVVTMLDISSHTDTG